MDETTDWRKRNDIVERSMYEKKNNTSRLMNKIINKTIVCELKKCYSMLIQRGESIAFLREG